MKVIDLREDGHVSVKCNINNQLVDIQLFIAGWKSGAAAIS